MKKKMLSLFIAVSLTFTACSSTTAPTETDAVESTPISTESVEPSETPAAETESPVESETPEPSVEPEINPLNTKNGIIEYTDSVISCTYNSSILNTLPIQNDGTYLYGLIFGKIGKSTDEILDDISSGSCLYVISISDPASSNTTESKDNKSYFTDFLETLFEVRFNSELKPDSKISSVNNFDNTIECKATLKDSTLKCKLISYTDESIATIIIYKLLSNEPRRYANALNKCYNSIQSINSDNNIIVNDSNKITEGKLFDSVNSIHDNVQLEEYKDGNRLEIEIHLDPKSLEEDVVRFFSIVDKICADCDSLLESYSRLRFELFADTDINITSLFYSKSDNSNIFYSNKPFTLFDEYTSIVNDMYNSYQPSNSNFRKSDQRLDDLKKEYDLD